MGQQTTKSSPLLPTEIRALIWKNALQEAKVCGKNNGAYYPCSNEASSVSVDDLLVNGKTPVDLGLATYADPRKESISWFGYSSLPGWPEGPKAVARKLLHTNIETYQAVEKVAIAETYFRIVTARDFVDLVRTVRSKGMASSVERLRLVPTFSLEHDSLSTFFTSLRPNAFKAAFPALKKVEIDCSVLHFILSKRNPGIQQTTAAWNSLVAFIRGLSTCFDGNRGLSRFMGVHVYVTELGPNYRYGAWAIVGVITDCWRFPKSLEVILRDLDEHFWYHPRLVQARLGGMRIPDESTKS